MKRAVALKVGAIMGAGALIGACSAAEPEALPAGVWSSEGFGYVAVSKGGRIATYDVSSAGCVKGLTYSEAAFRDLYGSAALTEANDAILSRGPTKDFLKRREELPSACAAPLADDEPYVNFDVFAATFSDFYPFFEERGVDWPSLVAATRPKAGADLFDALSSMAEALNDGHVTLTAKERSFDPDVVVAPGRAPDGADWSWKSLRSSLRDFLQGAETPLAAPAAFAGERRVLYGKVGADIGYLAIFAEGGWAEGQTEETPAAAHAASAADVMDRVLADLSGVRAMIIDLRVNSGGFDAVSFEIASHFAKKPVIAFTRQAKLDVSPRYDVMLYPSVRATFDGPVAVLIGVNTVSAGESLAQAFAALPNARLFGHETRGILSDAIPKTLPNGWEFTLSVETLRSPEGVLLEVDGVSPDEAADPIDDPTAEEMWARDLRRAVDWLRRRDPAHRIRGGVR